MLQLIQSNRLLGVLGSRHTGDHSCGTGKQCVFFVEEVGKK